MTAKADTYEEVRYKNEYSAAYHNRWFESITIPTNGEGLILDNGCGVGKLSEFVPSGKIVGIDVSTEMLEKAKNRMPSTMRGDSRELPFKNNTFDIVLCKGMLHHFKERREAVSEIKRVLKPSGEFIITEPIKSLLSYPRRFVKDNEHFSEGHEDFERQELIKIIEEGFYIKKIKYFGYLAYPLLGFPDIFHIFKYFPFKKIFVSMLLQFDDIMARIPYIRTQSWMITINCVPNGEALK